METLEELKEYITDMGYEDTVVFDNPSYVTAFIGLSNECNAVYDYEKMIEYLMETDGMEYDDAMEFIEYNTIRALPYMGSSAPVVVYPINY